ncbi:hypothetical protein B0A49_13963 [Cryomyces minteri]|uniref:Uncharacterized protein n=1 Tax=Cryomyces minteri TaxID=331657 RepID=A0A4U0VJG3_9PEZI|nr:hypothetical protein B0A49_13963 [Cryomyces minteri]
MQQRSSRILCTRPPDEVEIRLDTISAPPYMLDDAVAGTDVSTKYGCVYTGVEAYCVPPKEYLESVYAGEVDAVGDAFVGLAQRRTHLKVSRETNGSVAIAIRDERLKAFQDHPM